MLILNNSVTRDYWVWFYRFLTRRHSQGYSRRVARIDGHIVWMVQGTGLGHSSYYAVFRDSTRGPRPVAWLALRQRPGWLAWEVAQLWVFPQFRGQGLARKLYQAVINYDNQMVASGKTHTTASRALWESFIRYNLFNTWAHDFSKLQSFCDVFWDKDDEKISSSLSLYSPCVTNYKRNKNNVRLVAVKKG